eukprot:c20292_g1_i1.p1 GENE.c20292_g1_i1~~c20292_g1_i1.p1  ORF type:complete len:994 (-),score=429.46 c20292_g1_i1:12-2993(-)
MTTIAIPKQQFASAKGFLTLLKESEDRLKIIALEQLNQIVDVHWAEVAEELTTIEALYEDDEFPRRELAALVASKVFYHLGEFGDSLNYALGAGELFDVRQPSEFVDTMVSKAIDHYITLRSSENQVVGDENSTKVKIDPRLESIVDRMFERCFTTGKFKQALGIALESQRLDVVKSSIAESKNVEEMLEYCFKTCTKLIRSRKFRQEVLSVLVDLHLTLPQLNYLRVSQCYLLLNRPESIAETLQGLVNSKDVQKTLIAYQVAFDLVDDASQEFLLNVIRNLSTSTETSNNNNNNTTEPKVESMDIDQSNTTETLNDSKVFEQLRSILSGHITVRHHVDFLHRHCHTDMQILKNIQISIEARSSALFTSLVSCNAIMHAGTTNDKFLRANLDWLRQAQNWAKFTAIGSLGLIRFGQIKEGMTLLKDFLPNQNLVTQDSTGIAYQEGGALYALGLINTAHGNEVVPYLLNCLKQTTDNVLQHGACLGLGLAAFATSDNSVYEELKAILFQDDTVAAEAAALGMGLVMCGSGNVNAVEEMLRYAHGTLKEKIIRALSLGVALIMYKAEENATPFINRMVGDQDQVIRYGGIHVIALAYAATADNSAIRQLLHVAVSDVSQDVRRAAVTAIGFVLASEREECPKVVSLLSESYNPHVRYGSAMAVGISCAGTGLQSAIDLLQPMTTDKIDYVRQAAQIALAMVLVQVSEAQKPVVKEVREKLQKVVQDKHEETLAKVGAILAQGIIDAGGRNATISLHSDSGFTKMGAVVGMALFTQFWYWFPLTNLIGLAIKPTALIAVNKDLATPNMTFLSNSPASQFAYPPVVAAVQQTKGKKGTKAVLSTTKKQAAKDKTKENAGPANVETPAAATSSSSSETKTSSEEQDVKMEDATKPTSQKEEGSMVIDGEKPEPEKEKTNEVLKNPARVVPSQQKVVEFILDQRYVPVNTSKVNGFVVVNDTQPGSEQDLVQASIQPTPVAAEEEPEPEAPAPFRWP